MTQESPDVSKLLRDIKYELQRVMMGARWERASFNRLLERIDETLLANKSIDPLQKENTYD